MSAFREDIDKLIALVGHDRFADARLALEIATQFAALRERRNLTQQQVAERLGKTQQTISKIERPTHGGHNLAKLNDAVAALGATLDVTIVSLEDLAAYDELRPPKPTLEDICARRDAERRG